MHTRTGLKNLEVRDLVGRPFPLELFTRPGLRTKQVRVVAWMCVWWGTVSIGEWMDLTRQCVYEFDHVTTGGGDLPRAHAGALQEGPWPWP